LESLRPDVVAKRAAFFESIGRVPVGRLVFLDESGMNMTMGRSHAWVLKGQEYVDLRPMNRGKTLTLVGAIRRAGWVLPPSQSRRIAPANQWLTFVARRSGGQLPR